MVTTFWNPILFWEYYLRIVILTIKIKQFSVTQGLCITIEVYNLIYDILNHSLLFLRQKKFLTTVACSETPIIILPHS